LVDQEEDIFQLQETRGKASGTCDFGVFIGFGKPSLLLCLNWAVTRNRMERHLGNGRITYACTKKTTDEARQFGIFSQLAAVAFTSHRVIFSKASRFLLLQKV